MNAENNGEMRLHGPPSEVPPDRQRMMIVAAAHGRPRASIRRGMSHRSVEAERRSERRTASDCPGSCDDEARVLSSRKGSVRLDFECDHSM